MTAVSEDTNAQMLVRQLRPVLGDRLLLPTDGVFDQARRVWNGAVGHRPVAIARCLDVDEVCACVLTARECATPLSVRGGGHDWAGRALRDGGLVVDLSRLRRVEVDPQTRTACVAGGATTGDVVAAGRPYGLVVPTGVVRAVGMAGLTLAGGYGPLNGRYGLALDNLLSAELVLADGRRVTASPDADAELFWAIRGGGGNFGVVTGLTYRLHPLATVLAGMIMFPLVQAASVLRGYGAFLAAGPDEITVMAGFLCGPDGQTVLFLCPFYSGEDLRTGERLIASLQSLGEPVMSQIAPMEYDDALGMFDNGMGDGNHYHLRTRWLPALSEEAAEILIDTAGRITSPYSGLALHHFHGAATRPDRGQTAFALRDEHLLVEIIAAWTSSEADGVHREWADRASRLLAPMSLPGGYPNLLGPDDHERVRLSYGPHYDRLVRAKQHYDPDNIFASAVPTLMPAT